MRSLNRSSERYRGVADPQHPVYGTEGHRFESCRARSVVRRNPLLAAGLRPMNLSGQYPVSPRSAPPIHAVVAARLQRAGCAHGPSSAIDGVALDRRHEVGVQAGG
jgi:hypothetical protein